MRKFFLGVCFLIFGFIGFLITYTYTLFHQGTLNGESGWIVNFIMNDTLLPMIFFIIIIVGGSYVCVEDIIDKNDKEASE